LPGGSRGLGDVYKRQYLRILLTTNSRRYSIVLDTRKVILVKLLDRGFPSIIETMGIN
jgi:hypothetical protein